MISISKGGIWTCSREGILLHEQTAGLSLQLDMAGGNSEHAKGAGRETQTQTARLNQPNTAIGETGTFWRPEKGVAANMYS